MPADRGYQQRAKEGCREAFRQGAKSVLLVAPTGSGKTMMGAEMVADHLARAPTNTVNWYAHRRELEIQARNTLRDEFGLEVAHRGLGRHARVRVLGVQASVKRGEVPDCTLSFFDEAHHFAADEWGRLVHAAKHQPMLGATATPERGDGKGLDGIFDRIVVAAQPKELVDDGWLVACDVLRPSQVLKPDEIAQRPVDAYLSEARGSQCIVFAPHVKASEQYCQEFQAAGVAAAHLDGKTPAKKRERMLQAFADKRLQVICNVYVLTEGYDCPSIETVIVARGCGSPGIWIQMVGRGLRPYPGKTLGRVLDLRGVSHLFGLPDEDRVYSLEGLAIRRKEDPGVRFCQQCGGLLPDTGPCPQCERETSKEMEVPHATNDALIRFAAKRAEEADARVRTLARWLAAGRVKGWKDAASFFRYKAVYGHWPPSSIRLAAEEVTTMRRSA